jgi:membrane protein DedA with SNARE-associated domain
MGHLLDQTEINALLAAFGYWAVFAVVGMESAGLPLPGETLLIGAAIYARFNPQLGVGTVVLAAAAGAIVGDNVGYWIGRRYGTALLERFGARFGLGPDRLLLGQYLFLRWGGWIVFFGRFVTLLRVAAAVLAGANRLDLKTFMLCNAAGGVLWAVVFGYGAYYLTAGFEKLQGRLGSILALALLAGLAWLWRHYKIHEERLTREAKQALGKTRG